MVKLLTFIKNKYSLKRELFLAITMFVVAFSFLANFTFAAEMKISDEEVERVKTALDIVNTASNFGSVLMDGGNLMTVLKTAIRGGQAATDVTYGLLVLSAINEMEFMDLVLSQEYKDLASAYFNNIIDERTNLRSYWKGVGFDIPRVVSGNITGSMGALTLNTFEMTDKIILILTEFETLKKGRQYDGLWRYFDERMNGESHQGAWELAEPQVGWAANSISFRRNVDRTKDAKELEQQFATLYEKWGPYATPNGISEEYKKQVKSDLMNTLAKAINDNKNTFVEKEPSFLDKLLAQIENIKNTLVNLVSQANPFSAGPIAKIPKAEPREETKGNEVTQAEQERDEPREDLDNISEEQDILAPTELPLEEHPALEEPAPEVEPAPELEPIVPDEVEEPAATEEPETVAVELPSSEAGLCRRGDAGIARQYRVLISEVAWMGDSDSPNKEWIELKNIWGIPINLAGWQLQDKNQDIKLIFDESDAIATGGYLLLERSKDYTGALNNSNEAIYLFDNNCQLEDGVEALPDWPGGDNYSKKTMQRFDVFSWYTGAVTAGAENSSPPAILEHPSAAAPAPAPKPTYPKILITETQIGSPGNQKDDFVELYNPNLEAVSLADWYLQRKTETGQDFSSYVPADLLSGKSIQPKSYFLAANASSSLPTELIDVSTDYPLTENNTLILKNPNRDIVDQVSTDNPPVGKSYGREWSDAEQNYTDNFEIQVSTPRDQNQSQEEDDEEGNEDGGEGSLQVVINEIAWAGTGANFADEWIELYNNSDEDLDLTGWVLKAAAGTPEIQLARSILANGFYLLERTDDNTVNDIEADQIYTGALSNPNCEVLSLYDQNDNLIDETVCLENGNWPAGQDSPNYISMERIDSSLEADSDNWASNNRISRNGLDAGVNQINGTPGAENSVSKSSTQIPNGFTVTEDATLSYLGSPYLVEGSLIVSGAELTVEPGVVVKFKHVGAANQDALLKVENGILTALGTADQRIIFTSSSTEPAAGDWDGLWLENSNSVMENAVIQYGGKWHQPSSYEWLPYAYGAVYIDGGNAQVTNSLIEKSQTYGVWLKNSTTSQITGTEFNDNPGTDDKPAALYVESSSPTIRDSIFRNNGIGILAENNSSPVIENNQFIQNITPIQITSLLTDIIDNTFENNGDDGVLIRDFGFSNSIQEVNWQKINAPYFIDVALTIPSEGRLIVEPGVEARFKNNGQINADGVLDAQGTSQDNIILTGASQVPGAWRYIKFSSSSADSVLENVTVSYGGFLGQRGGVEARDGAIKVEGFDIKIKDSIFEYNRVAIELNNADFAGQSKNISVNNNEIGIYVSAGGRPNLSDIIFGIDDTANAYDIQP